MGISRVVVAALAALIAVGCATTASGRKAFIIVSDSDMAKMGATAFDQMKSQGKLANNPPQSRYVQCIADALIAQLPNEWRKQPWEVQLIADDAANAFALPGGKVGVNTGLLKVATTQDQLASVIGHELAHVIERHGAQRVSQQYATQGALLAVQIAGAASDRETGQLVGLLGAGAQVGVLLPFSRFHESDADAIGQQLMARAGFDPRSAAVLWENMSRAGGARAPQLLSTHPDPGQRIQRLNQAAPALLPVYEAARAAGRAPQCRIG